MSHSETGFWRLIVWNNVAFRDLVFSYWTKYISRSLLATRFQKHEEDWREWLLLTSSQRFSCYANFHHGGLAEEISSLNYKFVMLFLDSFSMSSQKAHQSPSPPSVEQILEDLAAARDDDVVFKSSIVAGESAQISKGKGNKLASHSGELISGVYWYLITLSYVDNVAKLIIERLSQESVFLLSATAY